MEHVGIAQPANPPHSSSIANLYGVLVRPGAVFRSLAGRPRILTPLLAYLLLAAPAGILVTRKIDWTSYYRRQLAQDVLAPSSSAATQNEIIAGRVARIRKFEPPLYVLGSALVIIATSFFYWLAFNAILGAGIRFRTTLSIVCYALVPIMLALCYLIGALTIRPDGSVDLQRVVPTGLAYYLPIPSAPWLVELGNSVELAWIWTLILVSKGVRAASSRRISSAACYGTVFGLWLLWVAAKVGWAGLFGL